ncbi:MAG: hypothetical protein JKX79_03060 [Labilibaculum sp.]|nr:hypothetical protein [Labilibaculum sp.]
MNNIRLVKFLSAVVSFVGLIVMAGWYLEIEGLKSILPIWVSMKFLTVFSFYILLKVVLKKILCFRKQHL